MSRPPFDLAAVEAATLEAIAHGHRILQTHRYAKRDIEHVARLEAMLDPAVNAVVLDAGCGVGEVSSIMSELRADLAFVLANISALQLGYCPRGARFAHLHCDFHTLPLVSACVDAVMFNSSLVQMEESVALAQAYRVMTPGAHLLVNEPVRISGDGQELEARLACRTLTLEDMLAAIEAAGFRVEAYDLPDADASVFRAALVKDNLAHLLDGIAPVMIAATKP